MKKLISLLMLSGMFLFAVSSYADTMVTNLVKSEIAPNDKTVSYTLDLGDVSNMSDAEITETIQKFVETNIKKTSEPECAVTIMLNSGADALDSKVTFTIKGPCDEIIAKTEKIAKDLVKTIKNIAKI